MASPSSSSPSPRPSLDPVAAFLSYLIPGLGQVLQGRIGKGILFFVCLYGLFFYGMALGQWKNVWLPDVSHLPDVELIFSRRSVTTKADKDGMNSGNSLGKALAYRPQFLGQFWIGAAAWPAIAQYFLTPPAAADGDSPPATKYLGHYMQAPTEPELNTLQRDGDKRWDLGWVYTVIAGVLNFLVIYDALAGPVIRDDETPDAASPQGHPA